MFQSTEVINFALGLCTFASLRRCMHLSQIYRSIWSWRSDWVGDLAEKQQNTRRNSARKFIRKSAPLRSPEAKQLLSQRAEGESGKAGEAEAPVQKVLSIEHSSLRSPNTTSVHSSFHMIHNPHVPSMFHIKSPNSQYGSFVLACSGNSGHRISPGMCFPRARLPKCSFTHVHTTISTRFACATCCNPIRKVRPLLEVWSSGFVASLQVLKFICRCRLQNHRQVFFSIHTFGICWILLGYCSMSSRF